MKPINVILDCRVEMPKVDDSLATSIEQFLRTELETVAFELSEQIERKLRLRVKKVC